jgi:tRNA 2-thiouridine synthesizing protein E
MAFEVNGVTYETDEDGYLANIDQWNEDAAKWLAEDEGVDMSESHWEVVNFLREYYEEYRIAPMIRILTKAIGKNWGRKRGIQNIFTSYTQEGQQNRLARLPDCQNQQVVYNIRKNQQFDKTSEIDLWDVVPCCGFLC